MRYLQLIHVLTLLFTLNHTKPLAAQTADGNPKRIGGFTPDTMVCVTEEHWQSLELLDISQNLQSAGDLEYACGQQAQVVRKLSSNPSHMIRLEFEACDEQITAATDQRFLVKAQTSHIMHWVMAEDLQVGDLLVSRYGIRKVYATQRITSTQKACNIELDAIHTYFVGQQLGLVAHNAVFMIPIFTWVIGEGVALAAPYVIATAVATGVIANSCERHNQGNGIPSSTANTDKLKDYAAAQQQSEDNISDTNQSNHPQPSQKHTPDQTAVINLAKEAKQKKGSVTTEEATTLVEWGKEAGLGKNARGPESHPTRKFGKEEHIHVGPVNHLPVKDLKISR